MPPAELGDVGRSTSRTAGLRRRRRTRDCSAFLWLAPSSSTPHFITLNEPFMLYFLFQLKCGFCGFHNSNFFSIIELFTLQWKNYVQLASSSGGSLAVYSRFVKCLFFHWLLLVNFFRLQTFVEAGRAVLTGGNVLRPLSHFKDGNSVERSCSWQEAPATAPRWAFCHCLLS